MIPTIHSNDSWTTLREVWLGDVYPADFYDHLDPQVRDVFYQITEWTKEDLAILERKLQEFGVKVKRPEYHSIDNHLTEDEQLIRPSITPRDNYVVVGNTLYIPGYCLQGIDGFTFSDDFRYPWRKVVNEYHRDVDSRIKYYNISLGMSEANMLRAGRDLYLNCNFVGPHETRTIREIFDQEIAPMFPGHRVHCIIHNGLNDANILKPGYIMARQSPTQYELMFPGWEVIVPDDVYDSSNHTINWWGSGHSNSRSFSDQVMAHAQTWSTTPRQTHYQINGLMIDEQNIVMAAVTPELESKLAMIGISVHMVPFRCADFWRAGLRSLILDVRRDGPIVDFFPEMSDR